LGRVVEIRGGGLILGGGVVTDIIAVIYKV